jgi:short subunit dehydrogenase-like uncharacterized protein
MSNRLDILVFGATGYTGQYVVEEIARRAKHIAFTWGVAGRTVDKLSQVLQQASVVTGVDNLNTSIEKVTANIADSQSLVDMCHRTKILIDCVGPVRRRG